MTTRHRSVPEVLAGVDCQGCRLVITGAGGWLGRELLEVVYSAWGDQAEVLALASSGRVIELASGRRVELHDWATVDVSAFAPTHAVHLAFLTREHTETLPARSYLETNLGLSSAAVRLIALPTVQGIMFTSSGAVKAEASGTNRDLYAVLKRHDEQLIPEVASALGKSSVSCRVWSVSGINIQKPSGFAIGSLIQQALTRRVVAVTADHLVLRRYVDAGELLGLGLLELLAGRSGSFDSGGELVEVGELAERIVGNLGCGAQIERVPIIDTLIDDYSADPAAMDAMATRWGVELADLDTQILRTASGLESRRQSA